MANPLLQAAEPLIVLVGETALCDQRPDAAVLYRQLDQGLRAFDLAARDAGIAPPVIDNAGQALRLFIDQSLAAARWTVVAIGTDAQPLAPFSSAQFSVTRFVEYLAEQVNREPRDHDLLELLYLLLVLGIDKALTPKHSDRGELDELITGLTQTVERDPAADQADLSPHWRTPVTASGFAARRFPRWVALTLAGLLLAAGLQGFRYLEQGQAEALAVELEFVARPQIDN